MNTYNMKKLKRAIRELVLAEIANSWKGAGYPEDIPIIEDNVRQARLHLDAMLLKLTDNQDSTPE